eukprot:TRINITY_DN7527_c1_g2_i1.p3 TRINITY_DN7527_c1_g2~~TRINITY_DN7527_c1_g2_i1.p3  ORF type:complete len:128 (-),score=6.05 TRINITY_DN7527_c1_g2_i1:42-425(-)
MDLKFDNECMGELCIYMPKTKEQFRLNGIVTRASKEEQEECLFELSTKDSQRRQFLLLFPSQLQIDTRAAQQVPQLHEFLQVEYLQILNLKVIHADYLSLGSNQFREIWCIDKFSESDKWTYQNVNP